MRLLIRYLKDAHGGSAAEFALVVLPFFAIVVGALTLGSVMYFNATMQHSVEDSARWASVNTVANSGTPPTLTAVRNHFNTRYAGPTLTTFQYNPVATQAACSAGAGTNTYHRVFAHAIYQLNAVVMTIPVTVQASACFP